MAKIVFSEFSKEMMNLYWILNFVLNLNCVLDFRGVSKSVTSSFICGGASVPSLSCKNIPPFRSIQGGAEIEADRRLFQAMDRLADLYT